ncbi:MAG TPA: hypothetical protein VFC94_05785 [Bacteroidaceae bacterium]|nr:hypothetical protein [Bacteroidaceae bacterium]
MEQIYQFILRIPSIPPAPTRSLHGTILLDSNSIIALTASITSNHKQ